jgi:hypothetical protein
MVNHMDSGQFIWRVCEDWHATCPRGGMVKVNNNRLHPLLPDGSLKERKWRNRTFRDFACVGAGFSANSDDHMKISPTAVTLGGRRRVFCQRGDVLMEYVILLVCLLPVLVGVQSVMDPSGGQRYASPLFNPSGDYTNNFGLVGAAFYNSYTNIIVGISLPVP